MACGTDRPRSFRTSPRFLPRTHSPPYNKSGGNGGALLGEQAVGHLLPSSSATHWPFPGAAACHTSATISLPAAKGATGAAASTMSGARTTEGSSSGPSRGYRSGRTGALDGVSV